MAESVTSHKSCATENCSHIEGPSPPPEEESQHRPVQRRHGEINTRQLFILRSTPPALSHSATLPRQLSTTHVEGVLRCVHPLLRAVPPRVGLVASRPANVADMVAERRTGTVPSLVLERVALEDPLGLAIVSAELAFCRGLRWPSRLWLLNCWSRDHQVQLSGQQEPIKVSEGH